MNKQHQETTQLAMMTHVFLLQPTAETTGEALASVFKSVHALQKQIPCILAIATDENQSSGHRGYTRHHHPL